MSKKVDIKIGNKKYNVSLAQSDEELEQGLMNKESLDENEGMLFIFDEVQPECAFWMKDTPLELDIIFINDDMEVISVQKGIPNDENLVEENDVWYVLEVNQNSGIKSGDELEFINDKKVKEKMQVLASDGTTQMELDGSERIFSRKSTKVLISKAKKADILKTEGSYKSLGKYMFKELDAQDSRSPEYVKKKD